MSQLLEKCVVGGMCCWRMQLGVLPTGVSGYLIARCQTCSGLISVAMDKEHTGQHQRGPKVLDVNINSKNIHSPRNLTSFKLFNSKNIFILQEIVHLSNCSTPKNIQFQVVISIQTPIFITI